MYKFFALIFLSLFFIACDSDADAGEFAVGSDYVTVGNSVIQIDTVSAEMATINFDSLITSSQSRILVGNYDDPIFGKLKSESYFQLAASDYYLQTSSSDTEANTYVFDSIAMILKYDDYFFGDTTKVQKISIHRLAQTVKPNSEDDYFYNNSSLKHNSESLATYSYKPRPLGRDSINIRLNDDFGQQLFLKLRTREITNFDQFKEYLKGMVIVPDDSQSSNVIGFSLDSKIRLYYSKYKSDAETSYVKEFSVLDATKQFNSISLDKTGTIIQNLPVSTTKLSSKQTGNKGFIQSGSGVACRVDFPSLKQLKYLSEKGTIVDAELSIKPVNNTYSGYYALPDSLQVYVADNLNRISTPLTNSEGIAMHAVLNKTKDELNENVKYTLSVGGFLQKELNKKSDNRYSLIFTIPNYNKEVKRVVLGDQNLTANKMELKIYYLTY